MRRFAVVSGFELQADLPQRKTSRSAGYDLAAAADIAIAPDEIAMVPTGLKAYLADGEFLALVARSSLGVRRRLMLANNVGIIDGDYADSDAGEGQILVPLWNFGTQTQTIAKGERIAQAIFVPYRVTDDDQAGGTRRGGFGSTGQ